MNSNDHTIPGRNKKSTAAGGRAGNRKVCLAHAHANLHTGQESRCPGSPRPPSLLHSLNFDEHELHSFNANEMNCAFQVKLTISFKSFGSPRYFRVSKMQING